jgi:hypothetical protein
MVAFEGNADQQAALSAGNNRQALHIDPSNTVLPLSPSDIGLLRSTRSVESFEIGSVTSASYHDAGMMEAPNFGHYQMLIASLLLTTLMAVGSAFDAKSECIDQEMYKWLLNYFDDDSGAANNEYYEYDDYYTDFVGREGRAECLHMFRYVIIPVGATTLFLGALSLYIIHRHAAYLETISETYNPSHMAALLQLLVPLVIVLLTWTYAIFAIMLKPKVNPSLYQQNPFKSLAAVDEMGHIGDNANLYYLSWINQTQAMVLVYLVMVECIRRFRRRVKQNQHIEQARSFSDHITMHEQIQTMLSYTSARRLASLYKKRRKKWYRFIFHLRKRSGFWVAAFFSSIVLFASSAYVFVQVLVSLASSVYGSSDFRYRDVCSIIEGTTDEIPEEFCTRSIFAVLAGGIAACLCFIAMIMHILVRRRSAVDEDTQNSCSVMATQVLPGAMDPETTRCHLGIEFLLSFCLSALLGINAVFATGVQGPAATVGNLYYASWLSFLLCLRICLGCLEELYHVRVPGPDPAFEASQIQKVQKGAQSQASSISGSEISIDMHNYKRMAKKQRSSHLRKYIFLSTFSTVCFASALDAAYNQETEWTREQKYVIFAPAAVAVISVIMFLLCLKPQSYAVVSHICFGGLMSVVCFVVWLIDLIITMHSEDSWAVNSIGEMKLANLYYFSWAAILTAALQMISYLKPLLGDKSKDATFLVWAGIVKVCMVILGAASHVWYNIKDSCSDVETESAPFCSRTRFAQFVACAGVLSGWSVMGSRILGCSISSRTRHRAEALLSIMLVILFGVAVALITSIGGPGQSVGDLYYSTWLAFWVSIGIFVSCYDQLKQEELESGVERYHAEEEEEDTRYVHFDGVDTYGKA